MATTHTCSDLLMGKGSSALSLVNITTSSDCIFKHGNYNFSLNRKLLQLNVVKYLLKFDTIIKIGINMVTELANTLHGHLKRLITLVKVFLGAREVSRFGNVLHAHHLVFGLSLHSILIN